MATLKKREKILLGVTGTFVLVFVLNQFVCSSNPEPQVADKTPPEVDAEEAAPPAKPMAKTETLRKRHRRGEPPMQFTEWERDPFAEAYRLAQFDSTGNDSGDFVLRGVIRKGNESYVLIGDAILKEGERQGDLQIVSIDRERVVCRKGNNLVTLVLNE